MTRSLGTFVMVGASLAVIFGSAAALAQKQGGTLRVHALDSPPSLSMHEEADAVPARATMGLFNNLVMFDQHAKQNNMQSIVPDLATGWSWSEDGTELTFPLREGVKWHDGKPFTAEDVKCTWDLLTGKSSQRLRLNPRKSWYHNLEEVTTNGDFEVTFHLHRPQPALSRCSLPAVRWSIRAMSRQPRCDSTRSAPARSNSSSSSRTSVLR